MMHRDGYLRLLASVHEDRKQEDGNKGAAACRSGDKSARKDAHGEIENPDMHSRKLPKRRFFGNEIHHLAKGFWYSRNMLLSNRETAS